MLRISPITKEKIKDIAENLDCGFRCFIHTDTKEIKFVPDLNKHPDMESDDWVADNEEIENNFDFYVEIEPMDSGESFQLMTDFVDTVNDEKIKEKLEQAVNGAKPFRNFKFQVDNSGSYRDMWFKFKEKRLMDWVENQLKENSL